MQPSLTGYKPFYLVDNATALQQCLQELSMQRIIAFDLEFDNHSYSYGFTLCLVQVATPEACYIIDPFASIELGELYALFEEERIQKIVHSPGEDLRLLHALECYPKNIFDTEVVAKLLNYEHTSLAVLLQEKLGMTMSKKQQRSNWLIRPLTPEQIQYAADDVAWLHILKGVLEEEAAQKDLIPIMLEEQAVLSTTIYQQEVKTFFLKPADLYTLSPYEQHVLNALLAYRDGLAQQHNKPAYRMMDEELVRALAAGTLLPYDLPNAKGMYGGLKNARFADKVSARLRAIRTEADHQGLSQAAPARQQLSPEERKAKDNADRDREIKFVPVQQVLIKRYGVYAARFMLSNGMVNDLLKGKLTINRMKLHYRQVLIRSIAQELGIDLSAYE